MAIETFRSQLKAKAKTLGVTNLQNKRIDAYAATLEEQNPNLSTDDDHTEKVDAFLKFVDLKQIASYDDWQANKNKKEAKDEKKDDTKKDDVTTDEPADDPTEPAWAKALRKQNETLAAQLAKIQQKETKETITARLKKDLDGVPDWFYKNWPTPEKDEDYEPFLEKVKTEWEPVSKNYQEQTQGGSQSGQQQRSSHTPQRASGGGKNDQASKEQVDAIVNNIM